MLEHKLGSVVNYSMVSIVTNDAGLFGPTLETLDIAKIHAGNDSKFTVTDEHSKNCSFSLVLSDWGIGSVAGKYHIFHTPTDLIEILKRS